MILILGHFSLTGVEMKSKTIQINLVSLVSAFLSISHAGVINLGDPVSATQAASTWYVDRYAPNGFVYESGSGILEQTISAVDRATARPATFSSTFYDTQGRKYDFGPETTAMSIELYIPGDPLQQRQAGFWGTGIDVFNQITGYPILEYTSDNLGGVGAPSGPRIQGWDNNGWISYYVLINSDYDAWHKLTIALANDQWNYLFDDNFLGSVDAFGSVGLANVMVQGYNNFTTDQGDYTIQWRNMQVNTPENNVPEPGTMALMALPFIGMIAVCRRKSAVAKSLGLIFEST